MGTNIPLWDKTPFFWEDNVMVIWLLEGKSSILECRNSDLPFQRGSVLITITLESAFISQLFSMGKHFIFKEDLVFRVSENCSLLFWKIYGCPYWSWGWVQRRHWKPVLTLGDGGIPLKAHRLGCLEAILMMQYSRPFNSGFGKG